MTDGSRRSRRIALGNDILSAFEDHGWHWTDEEVVEGIKALVKKAQPALERDYTTEMPEALHLRFLLCRKYGESQVLPRFDRLPAVALRLRDELLIAMKRTDNDVYYEIISILEHWNFERELEAIANCKELYSVTHKPQYQRCFKILRAHAVQLRIVPPSLLESIAFNTVVWINAVAARKVLGLVGQASHRMWMRKDEGQMPLYRTQVSGFLAYCAAQRRAKVSRAKLREGLAKLPPELRVKIFKQLAAQEIEYFRWTPIRYTETTITKGIRDVLKLLCDIEFTPEYYAHYPSLPARSAYRFVQLDDLIQQYSGEVTEAIVTGSIIEHVADFPDYRRPNPSYKLVPRALGSYTNFIRQLDLRIFIPAQSFQAVTYSPAPLFNAQDHLPNLKAWLPALKILHVEVLYPLQGLNLDTLLLQRRPSTAMTTLEEEVVKIVDVLRHLNLERKWIRYTRWEERKEVATLGDNFISADGTCESTSDALVEHLLAEDFNDLVFEVRSVGDGVGDLDMALRRRAEYYMRIDWFYDGDGGEDPHEYEFDEPLRMGEPGNWMW